MTAIVAGGVDCDLHPAVPHLTSLLPYMNDYWRDQVTTRGMVDLVSQSYPANSPISSRPDWRPAKGKPGSSLDDMRTQALDPFKVSFGIGLLHWIEDYTIISDLLVVWLAIVQPSLAVFQRCSALNGKIANY